ncbi:MAG: hypothetical protein R3F49_10515 [Planctomycetota bacterium]
MSDEPQQPFKESDLDSPEYRERLMRKLNCLIAVLEVANAKVDRSLSGPQPDLDRLTRIKSNLTSTLDVCRRARKALERREALPEGLPENLAAVVRRAGEFKRLPKRLPAGASAEMGDAAERKRFEMMGRITQNELRAVDLDALAAKLTS